MQLCFLLPQVEQICTDEFLPVGFICDHLFNLWRQYTFVKL